MNISKRVYARIDLDIIKDNMIKMHKCLNPGTRMMAVVKTDGYGHGATEIMRAINDFDFVDGFCVATIEEAIELRNAGCKKTILILGYTFPEQYDDLILYDLIPAFFREDNIEVLNECAIRHGKKVKVHIKVDTGMGRIGIFPDETGIDFVRKVLNASNILADGIFTHFARADETDKTAVKKQFDLFTGFIQRVKDELGYDIPVKHCSNSAGIVDYKDANMDLVRAGITLYGLCPSNEITADMIDLKPALTLYSHITYLKKVPPWTPISYGGTYVTEKETRVATIPIGYGDGYPRSLSNKGYVLIHGKKANIIGRVCMDQMMVDVTDIPEAKMDDLVTVIGRDGDEVISAEFLGDISDRFNYELVCDIGKRVPRIYVKDGLLYRS